jgi:hypothetical protein
LLLVAFVSPSVTLGGPVEKTKIPDGHQKNTPILNAVGQIGGPIQGVAVQESIAYVTVGPRLMVMQVSQTGSLTEMGGTPALPVF